LFLDRKQAWLGVAPQKNNRVFQTAAARRRSRPSPWFHMTGQVKADMIAADDNA
jgi:hypothetical protein